MTYILDTNIVSELTRRRGKESVLSWLSAQDEDQTFLSVMTVAELRQGVALAPSASRQNELSEWLYGILLARYEGRIISVSQPVAEAWGILSAKARVSGKPAAVIDCFIAATAAVHSKIIVTRNVRDFEPFGVEILNPFEPA